MKKNIFIIAFFVLLVTGAFAQSDRWIYSTVVRNDFGSEISGVTYVDNPGTLFEQVYDRGIIVHETFSGIDIGFIYNKPAFVLTRTVYVTVWVKFRDGHWRGDGGVWSNWNTFQTSGRKNVSIYITQSSAIEEVEIYFTREPITRRR